MRRVARRLSPRRPPTRHSPPPLTHRLCSSQKFSISYRDNNGLFITKYDKGRIASVLDNWRRPHVDIIVVTDGSRILGLGDLGANGMGIPIGKLTLYTAAAGFHPTTTLPITLDVGTNNDEIRQDERYVGVPEARTMSDEEYYEFIDEFMAAVYAKWPNVLVQFEDFSVRRGACLCLRAALSLTARALYTERSCVAALHGRAGDSQSAAQTALSC